MYQIQVDDRVLGHLGVFGELTPVRKALLHLVRMSSIYSTDTFTCDTTNRTLLAKTLTHRARGDIAVMFQAENFPGCRMTQEAERACRQAVRAAPHDDDQISRLCPGELHAIRHAGGCKTPLNRKIAP